VFGGGVIASCGYNANSLRGSPPSNCESNDSASKGPWLSQRCHDPAKRHSIGRRRPRRDSEEAMPVSLRGMKDGGGPRPRASTQDVPKGQFARTDQTIRNECQEKHGLPAGSAVVEQHAPTPTSRTICLPCLPDKSLTGARRWRDGPDGRRTRERRDARVRMIATEP